MTEPDELDALTDPSLLALDQLRDRFRITVGSTVEAFRQLGDQLHRAPASPEVLDALSRELHRFRGTAGSYGYDEVGRLATALDQLVTRWMQDITMDLSRRGIVVRQFARILATSFAPEADGVGDELAPPVLLVDLPDREASALIAEAFVRGHFVERLSASQAQASIDARPPGAVIAAARVPLTVPAEVVHVLLRDIDGGVAPHAKNGQVLDLGTPAVQILQLVETLSARSSGAGATVLVLDEDAALVSTVHRVTAREGMQVVSRPWEGDPIAALQELQPVLVVIPWRARATSLPAPIGRRRPAAGVGLGEGAAHDTIAILRRIRSDRRYAELPLLILGPQVDRDTRATLFEAGADDLQATPVVEVELARRVNRLIEVRRQRLMARSIHPATALTLPERTRRDFDEALREATVAAQATSLIVMRPLEPPDGRQRTAQWQRECAMVAGALALDGGRGGFLDDTALGILLPMGAEEAVARVAPFAEAAAGETGAWAAGVVEQLPGSEAILAELIRAAEEAWLVARDTGALVRRWDPSDVTVAPDVILVEDDAALADLVRYALSARGLTHRRFEDGPSALAELLTLRCYGRHPILIVDVDLPGLDGFSLFDRLRVERPGVFRVIFMSVRGSEADQLRALRAGALDYLRKPVSLRVLLAKISVWRGQGIPG